ncbi:MAG: hypothetical protein GY703_02575 [Gammaproteobacteria bacterium]|nr:hypothetical protein [Gammaproteobacteria bacterium]
MGTYLLAMLVIFVVLLGWVAVQQLSQRFAARHPEFGPVIEKSGCGNCGGKCKSRKQEVHCAD